MTLAKFKAIPSLADVQASVTGASGPPRERDHVRIRLLLVSPFGDRFSNRNRTPRGIAALALLLTGCAPVAAGALVPRSAVAPQYRTLYLGLDGGTLSQPPLVAATAVSALAARFPPPSPGQLHRELQGLGSQLYLGITLGRLSCRDDYLAKVRYGPGARLTLTVAQHQLAPGAACFELIGPVRYQVLALPLQQFPGRLRLSIVVQRPLGTPRDQMAVLLP
ncbi:MAG: hypothetical protein ACRENX_12510 [Candidatus Dormibacteria bacterium]